MKHGWEIKKLGEFIKEYSVRNKNGVDFPVYSVTNSQGFCKDYFSKEVASKEKSTYKIVPRGCFAYNPSRINVGSVDWQNHENNVIVSPLYVVFEVSDKLNNDFLLYYLKSNHTMQLIKNLATGTVRANLKFDILSSFSIPIPPLSIQSKIVSELDGINGILEKKREQIKELDALAQSIFYDMFGDPIQNEKGWEVKKLGEVGELARGVSKHRPRNAPELLGGNIPLIQTGDVSNAGMYIEKYNSTYSELGLAQSRLWPLGTLCITIAATIGKCSILTFDACFPDSVVGFIVDDKSTRNEYIYYIFKDLQKILEENAPAVAQKNINLQVLNNQYIPLPPLPLQQAFAAKIEAIEKQKELVKRSIAEVETLLASRMQHYFEA